jgi:hypothetical protein
LVPEIESGVAASIRFACPVLVSVTDITPLVVPTVCDGGLKLTDEVFGVARGVRSVNVIELE